MNTLIETYRGWEISFNTESESFYVKSNEFDRGENKKSFSAAKKYIDDFIKDNLQFVPIWVQKTSGEKIKLIGIRKDKRFVYERRNGSKDQLSDYEEKDYFLVDDVNIPIFAEIDRLSAENAAIVSKIKEMRENLVKVGLEGIKAKYAI